MENLNLKKLWEVCNILSDKESELSEQNCYISLLGINSDYLTTEFDSFLSYYSFKVEDNNIVIFNDDLVPFENFSNNDISYVPIPILGFGEKELENYIEQSIKMQLEQQEKDRIAQKEDIKRQIELLNKRLNTL
jgi:hypothetical protein